MTTKNLGPTVRAAREAAGMNEAALDAKAGLPKGKTRKLEADASKMTVRELIAIAVTLGYTPGGFLSRALK